VKVLFAALHESGFRIVFCCALLSGAMSISVAAENAPGVTDSEIKIGQTMPYTGPVTQFSECCCQESKSTPVQRIIILFNSCS
jgi:hypothetical protein